MQPAGSGLRRQAKRGGMLPQSTLGSFWPVQKKGGGFPGRSCISRGRISARRVREFQKKSATHPMSSGERLRFWGYPRWGRGIQGHALPADNASVSAYREGDERRSQSPENAGERRLPGQGELRRGAGGMVDGRGIQGARSRSQNGRGNPRAPQGSDGALYSRSVDARGRDARLVKAYGKDWPHGWNELESRRKGGDGGGFAP
jgi:hypothetical protein